jgi:uncharacterized membrane protein YraQ (UPF0718 family)
MEFIITLTSESLEQVWLTWLHNWPYLAISLVIAVGLKLYVNAEKVSAFLQRYRGAGVIAATTAAVTTPFCSCGTTAVILGMMTSSVSWAPIVAFMVASPLTSPEGLVYSAGLFGWPFALAFYLASIVLGLSGGWIAAALEKHGWLANQARNLEPAPAACGCSAQNRAPTASGRVYGLELPLIRPSDQESACGCASVRPAVQPAGCGCGSSETSDNIEEPEPGCACGATTSAQSNSQPKVTQARVLRELYYNAKYLVTMFTGFAFVGYFLNGLFPASWVTALFGSGNVYSVPLAATLGLPLYINSEASLPLVRAMLENGMSMGAALAFLIVGAGTSIGAIAGAFTIARWRVVALVVGVLWVGAILFGYAFNLALMLNLF